MQASSFQSEEDYGSLIHVDQTEKENSASYSNLNMRNYDSGLSRSKATKKNHTQTVNEETGLEEKSGSWSQANISRNSVFERLYQDSKTKKARQGLSRSKLENTGSQSKKMLNDSLYHNTSLDSTHQVKIYEKNTKLKEESKKRNQFMKAQCEAIEEQNCTLVP